MTIGSVKLIYGVVFSFLELRKKGIINFEDFFEINGMTKEKFENMSDEDFLDYWGDWKFYANEYLDRIPHDMSEKFPNAEYFDTFFIVGIGMPNIFETKDIFNASQEFETLMKEDNKYFSYFRTLKPMFYMVPDDCHCCS